MKLYHHPYSSNARRAMMTADLLGLAVEKVLVDLMKGEQRKPDYVSMNPNAKVPLLDDDGFLLWESHAIMQYLADKKPGNTLYPTEPRARADVNRWMFWSSHHFSPAVGMVVGELIIKKMRGGEPDMAIVERGRSNFADLIKVLDQHLAAHEYLCGKALTLADLSVAAPLMYAGPANLSISGHPHVERWFAKIQELDAWKKTAMPS